MAVISDLSCYFPYDRILAVAGVSVKGSVPDITACPICKRPSLTVYADPLSAKSKWLRCGSCRFSGDTIETYQRISRSPTVIDAIQEARRNGLCDGPSEKLTPDRIQSYAETYPAFRAKVSDIWDCLTRQTVENPSPDLIRHIQSKRLWHGWMRGPHKRMARFLGGAERRVVDDLFVRHFEKRILPKKGYGVVLAVPFQDVPGRICGLRFIGHDAEMTAPLSPIELDEPEGGLAMLDVLEGMEKTVYAISRLDFVLQAQKLNLINRETPLKMVAYSDDTLNAWSSVNAEKLVFWSDEIDWRLFRQARRIKNAWITAQPNLDAAKKDVNIYLREHTPDMLLHMLDSTAVPWPRFMANWLVDKRRSPLEVQATLAASLFTPLDMDAILHECPEKDKDTVKRLIEECTTKGPEQVFIQGKTTVEKEDGWYHVTKGGESLITDAVVKLSHEAVDTGMGEVFWYGEIRYRKHRILFAGESFREIDADPLKWLQDKLARVGLGYPRFERSWARSFTNLVKSFSRFEVVKVTDRLGMNASGEILFPHFSIKDGEVTAVKSRIPTPEAPALDVMMPSIRGLGAPEPITPARAAWFAAAAAYVARLTNQVECPVYIVDSSPISSITAFMNSAGMLPSVVDVGSDEEKRKLLYVTRKYNYPVKLTAPGEVLDRLPHDSYSSCFVPAQRLSAVSLCTRRPGIILRDAQIEDGDKLPSFDDVIWYMAHLQRTGFDKSSGPVLAALRGFCQFLERYLPHFDDAHMGIASNRIRLCLTPGDSFLELLALLCLSGKLESAPYELSFCMHGGYAPNPGRKAVCTDPENGRVYLPKRAIIRACDRAGIPRPDLLEAEKDLSKRKVLLPSTIPDGFLVPFDLWNKAIKDCRGELNTPA